MRVAVRQRRLRRPHDRERLAQVPLVEARQVVGRDEVVGGLPAAHLGRLVAQPHVRDELEGVAQVVGPLVAEHAGLPGRLEARLGVDRRAAHRQGVHPGQLDDGADAAALDVEGVLVVAGLLEHEAPEEAQRRLVGGRLLGQVGEEHLGGRGCREHVPLQRREERRVAVHRAHVEEDARAEDRVGHRLVQPRRELLAPPGQGLAPPGVGGHDVAGAARVAALDEVVDRPGWRAPRTTAACSGRIASSMRIALSWSAASACSRRAREPSATQQ